MSHRVLVVEDDPGHARLYGRLLGGKFSLDVAGSLDEARRLLSLAPVDAMLLDWTLPDGTGLAFIDELRSSKRHRDLLIFMVTSHTGRERCLEALRSGADEFMEKPVDPEMLATRLDNLMHRKPRPWSEERPFSCDGLTYDPGTRKVLLNDKELPLRLKERKLLEFFIDKPNRIHSKDAVWTAVWGPHALHWEHTLGVTLANLRRDLGSWSAHLETHTGLGYLLNVSAAPADS